MNKKFGENLKDFISLAEASRQTGYHQDYLGFLCRTGKLKGFKIGRNWVTTNESLNDFKNNYKNGISEVTDETGNKIPVHVQTSADAENNFTNAGGVSNSAAQPSQSSSVLPALPELSHLKAEVLETIENRVEKIEQGILTAERHLDEQQKKILAQQEEDLKNKKQEQVVPLLIAAPAAERPQLHKAFASNFSIGSSGQVNTNPAVPGLPEKQQGFSKEKIKQLYGSFIRPQKSNLPVVLATGLIAIAGLVGSILWGGFFGPEKETTIVYQGRGAVNQLISQSVNQSSSGPGKTIVNNNTITKLLGVDQSQVYSLIDQRLAQYLAEGKFKGEKGEPGPQGIAGAAGLQGGATYVLPSNPSPSSPAGTISSYTYLSSQFFETDKIEVHGPATFEGPTTLNGSTTIASLEVTNFDPGFTEGSVVFQGVSGLAQDNGNFYWDNSQNAFAVGTSTIDASALVQLESTAKGFLAPRMTTAQRDAISSPATGLMVYNTSTNAYNVYNGSSWGAIGSGGSGTSTINTGIAGAFAYYTAADSTLDPQSTLFFSNSKIGIGTTTPSSRLQVVGDIQIGSVATTTAYGLLFNTGSTTNQSTIRLTATTSLESSYILTLPTTTPSSGQALLSDANGNLYFGTAGTSLSGGTNGYLARWTSSSALSNGITIDNGTVAGVNATSSSVTFNLQGNAGTSDVFNAASSTGASLFKVAANGSTTISSLGAGLVRSTAGGLLYTDAATYLTSALTSISGLTGPAIHVATSSDTNITISISTSTANTLSFVPGWTGELSVARGGTGTSSSPTLAGQLLGAHGSGSYGVVNLIAGSNITITTSTPGAITITSTDTGNSAWTIGSGLIYNATSTDLVGIGTITPTTTLFVQGKAGVDPFAIASSTGTALFTVNQGGKTIIPNSLAVGPANTALTTTRADFSDSGSNDFTVRWGPAHVDSSTIAGYLGYSGAPAELKLTYSNADFVFSNAGNERVRFTQAGNVGIGTTTPAARLSVTGSPTVDPFNISSTSGASILRVTQAGNLGVGTTTPQALVSLPLGTTAATGINLGDATANLYRSAAGTIKTDGNLVVGGATTLNGITYNWPASQSAGTYLKTDGSGNLTWAASAGGGAASSTGAQGNVQLAGATGNLDADSLFTYDTILHRLAIGTTSTSSSLTLQGQAGTAPLLTVASSSGSSLLTVLHSGNVGIGTNAPTRALDVVANVTHNDSGTASQLSVRGTADSTMKLNVGYDTTSNYGFIEAVAEGSGWQNLGLQPRGGNVGIGTATPLSLLQITSGSTGIDKGLRLQPSAGTNPGVNLFAAGTPDAGFLTFGNGTGWKFHIGLNSDAGATKFLTIVDDGKVGIGTTTPGQALVVVGSSTVTSLTSALPVRSTATGNLFNGAIALGSSDVSGILAVANGGTGTSTAPTVQGQLLMADSTGAKYTPGNLIAGSNITITTTTPGQITIAATGGSGTISTSTNAQAGKVATWTGLATLGNGALFDNGTVAGVNATSSSYAFNIQGTDSVHPLQVGTSSNTSMLVVRGDSGYVGIGTSTPTAKLSIVGSASGAGAGATKVFIKNDGFLDMENTAGDRTTRIAVTNVASYIQGGASGAEGKIDLYDTSGNLNIQHSHDSAGDIRFLQDSTELAIITRAGNLGVGTSTPAARISISGSPMVDPFDISSTSGTSLLRVTQAGNFGLGTTTPGRTLTVVGDIRATGILYDSTNSAGTSGQFLMTTATGYQWTATSTIFGGNQVTLTGSYPGYVTRWTGANTLGTGVLLDNGSFAGVYATSSSYSFNVRPNVVGSENPFNVESATGVNYLTVLRAGNVGIGTATPIAALQITGPTINETGASVSVTRGLYVSPNPLGTANVLQGNDYRALETSAYTLNLASTTAATQIYGSLFNQQTINTTTVATLANASNVYINGAPKSTSNLTITSSTALSIIGGTVSTTTNAIGLYVSAPTGATNNYAALFNGGNVGIGSTAPTSLLAVQGTAGSTTDLLNISSSTNSSILIAKSNGNVGIGVANPIAPLDVRTSVSASGVAYAQYVGSTLTATADFDVLYGVYINPTLNENGKASVSKRALYVQGGATALSTGLSVGAYATIDAPSNGAIISGSVGIGTSTPSARLSLNGTSAIDPFDISSTSGVSLLRFTQGGNLGIGTTTPGQALVVVGSSTVTSLTSALPVRSTATGNLFNGAIALGSSDVSGVLSIANGGTGTSSSPTLAGQLLGAHGSGSYGVVNLIAGSNITITTSTPGAITITSTDTGNSAWTIGSGLIYNATSTDLVGIGTITPTTTLFVQGKGGTNPFAIASSTGTQLLTVTQAGNVGISSSTPGYKFLVVGTDGDANLFAVASSTGNVFSVSGVTSSYAATINGAGRLLINGTGAGANTSIIDLLDSNSRIQAGSVTKLTVQGASGSTASGVAVRVSAAGSNINPTSGTGAALQVSISATNGFNPVSGTAVYNTVMVDGTINQTNSASGITRGVYLNPTLTSARDYRSLEIAAIANTLSTSTTISTGYNILFNPMTYSSASSSPYTLANASTLSLANPVVGTNVIISSSTALTITSSTLNASTTNGIGLYVQAPTGATNNYAALFNGGNVGIGSTAPTSLLAVQGTAGSTTDLLNVASSTNSSILIAKSNGNVGIGTSAPSAPLHLVMDNIAVTNFNLDTYSDGGFNSTLLGRKAHGTAISPSAVASDEVLMTFGASGYGTTGFSSASRAAVKFFASENWTDSAQGTYMTFETTANGTATRTERVRVDNAGNLGVGTSTPSARLSLNGTSAIDPFDISSTSGVSLLRFTQGGNLGIGTTTPGQALVVVGSSTVTSLTSALPVRSTATGNLFNGAIALGSSDVSGILAVANGGTGTSTAPTVQGQLLMADSTGAKYTPGNLIAGSNITITTTTPGQITIAATGGSGNSAFTVGSGLIYNATSTDLVGIGTITPTTTLFVQGKGGTNPFAIASSTGTQLLTVTQAGKVGLGATPTYLFQGVVDEGVGSGEHHIFSLGRSIGNNSSFVIGYRADGAADTGTYLRASNSNILSIGNSGANQAMVISSGNVGIGSTTPNSVLAIQGTAGATTDLFNVTSSTNTSLFVIKSSGNIGIGTTTPEQTLVVVGSSTITSLTSALPVRSTATGNLFNGAIALGSSDVSGVLAIANGGTGTTSSPTLAGQLLGAHGSGSYGVINLVAGSNITLTTSTPGQITIASSASALSGGTNGYVARWTSASTLSTGLLIDSGSAAGVNATSSSYTFNVQGYSAVDPFNISSSTGTSILAVEQTGYVGIGTTSPLGILNIHADASSTANSTLYTASTSNAGILHLGQKLLTSGSVNGTYIGINSPSGFTGNYIDLQNNGTSYFKVTSGGAVSSAGSLTVSGGNVYGSATITNGNGNPMWIRSSYTTTQTGLGFRFDNQGNNRTVTSGITDFVQIGRSGSEAFAPTSGTGVFNNFSVYGFGINQTSTANGITRGVYISPTLTSAYDYRNLEVAATTTTVSNANPTSALYNVLFSPNTYETASSTAYTIANASTLTISGAPIASTTSLTITSSTALSILSNAVTSSVTNGIGLYVSAPTGATNNYAALFNGGNVGIGSTSPVATLGITGTLTVSGSTTLNSLTSALPVRSTATGNLFNGAIALGSSDVSGVLAIANGGTGTTSSPTLAGQLLGAHGSGSYGVINLVAGSNITLTTSTPGQITITGAAGSGSSAFTIGSGLIYNATSTDLVGIGTITPTTTLFVQGKAGVNPFAIASSTGTQLLTVTQAGKVGIGTSTPAALLTMQAPSVSGAMLFNIASTTGSSMLFVSGYGGLVQNISSTTAVSIQDGSGNSIFTVDSTSAANSGLDITAGGGQTGNLLNFYSSGGTFLMGVTNVGGLVQNISSTTAVSILNGSGISVFGVDTTNKVITVATSASTSIASILTSEGALTIGDDGLTGSTDGRIWIRSRGTTFRFNSTGNSADYSEFFYQLTASSTAGDIMVFDNSTTSPIADTGLVKVSTKAYDPAIAGAITTRGVGYNNADDDRQFKPNFANVGMLGHVAVKVSASSSPIRSGDFVTSSYEPGKAMKAERSGMVLGIALQDYDFTTATSSTSSPMIMVLVQPGYHVINNVFVLGENDGQLATATSTLTQATSSLASGFLINQKGVANILQLQQNGEDRLLIANDGSLSILASTLPTVDVMSVKNASSTLFTISAVGDITTIGHIAVGQDTAGTATIKAGDNQASVTFASAYAHAPKVVVTAQGIPDFYYGVATKTPTGFIITTNKPVTADISFDWIALAQPGTSTSESSLNLSVVPEPLGPGVEIVVSGGSGGGSTADSGDEDTNEANGDEGSVAGTSTPEIIDESDPPAEPTPAPEPTTVVEEPSSQPDPQPDPEPVVETLPPAPVVETPAPAPAPAAEAPAE